MSSLSAVEADEVGLVSISSSSASCCTASGGAFGFDDRAVLGPVTEFAAHATLDLLHIHSVAFGVNRVAVGIDCERGECALITASARSLASAGS